MKLSTFVAIAAVIGALFIAINPTYAVIYCYPIDSETCEIRVNGKTRQKRKIEDVRNRRIIFDGEYVRMMGG